MRSTDAQLLRDLPDDPRALEVFYRRHVETITRFIARRTTGADDLADLVAEVFVAVIESADRFDERRGSAVAWLYGIALNKLAERRRAFRRTTGLLAKLHGRGELTEEEYGLLEARIDAERTAPALLRAIDRLPPTDRALLELVALDDLSVTDAARIVGISSPAARMRMTRIRRRMRTLIGEDEDRPDPVASTPHSQRGTP